MREWSIEPKNRTLVQIKSYKRQGLYFATDVHFDSKKCHRDAFKDHLKQAESEGRAIILGGDLFDVMGTKHDPRSTKGDIRPEYQVTNYLDAVLEDLYEFLKPYKDNIAIISDGNHETAIYRRHETDLIGRLCKMLQEKGSPVWRGGYSYYMNHILGLDKKFVSQAAILGHLHHGFGGNAKRSKGVLGVDLDTATYQGVDYFMRGHIHQKWYVPRVSERVINLHGLEVERFTTRHYQCGTYKEKSDGYGGWEIEKHFDPSMMGGWNIDLAVKRAKTDTVRKVIKQISAVEAGLF